MAMQLNKTNSMWTVYIVLMQSMSAAVIYSYLGDQLEVTSAHAASYNQDMPGLRIVSYRVQHCNKITT